MCDPRARAAADDRDHDGFTLIEMVVAIALIAVIFSALASVLASGLKGLAVSKARVQANDIATQGIEDLQRYSFNNLGVCADVSRYAGAPSTPTGLTDAAKLANCPADSGNLDYAAAPPDPAYENPCNGDTGTIPLAYYACTKVNVKFLVRRYVAWTDATHQSKRMAVYVDWIDQVGKHEVSQQSSLRSPDLAAITGLSPPTFTSTTVTASNPVGLDGSNHNTSPITLAANIANLGGPASTTLSAAMAAHSPGDFLNVSVSDASTFPSYNGFPVTIGTETFTVVGGAGTTSWLVDANGTAAHASGTAVTFVGDQVYANFQTFDVNHQTQTSTVSLTQTTPGGTAWSGSIPAGSSFSFGNGTQFISFGVVRASDGKTNATFSSTSVCFGVCSGATAPTASNVVVSPTTVKITTGGDLDPATNQTVTVTVQTTNITADDTVSFSFLTQSGLVTVGMSPTQGNSCPGSATATAGVTCIWSGVISGTRGYKFSPGTQSFYVSAQQGYSTLQNSIDKGATTAATSSTVTFQ